MRYLSTFLRPQNFDEFVGQCHLFAQNAPLRRLIESGSIPHSLFFGPPGSGKTTAALLIAKKLELPYKTLNATTLKVEEVRLFLKEFTHRLQKPLLFIDEIHRLSVNQEEVLLPFMERNEVILIGASTQNPYHSLTQAFRSRSMLFHFEPLKQEDLKILLKRIQQDIVFKIDDDALEYLLYSSGGDARGMLNLLDCAISAVQKEESISLELLKSFRQNALVGGSDENDRHYSIASAFIKSLRGSDENATIYYLALWLKEGEDVAFIARRMVIFASEDIGNANPHALNLAVSTMQAVSKIGMPEARIILAQCAIYLACCPKSNSAYEAINAALKYLETHQSNSIPSHLIPPYHNYLYPHHFGGWVKQEYMTEDLKFVHLKGIGYEKNLLEWLEKIKQG
ncbi:recombinase RarA [Helicobacter monodelphidis]|uniref:replication-associated recombination protein A n=1 Tax=Helicobacter sp. 15-1451 TaxID=2004995 RepID=UPI000DCEEF99|nr:replication-associated recombination protein A [Helicobacter sp. 15-1451]RAX57331.1 recombinase RarA [Helicobacter sp. 15-1451]